MTPSPHRLTAARFVRAAGEAILFSLVLITAWPFGATEAGWQYAAAAALVLLAGLWAAHAGLTGEFVFRPDLVSVALGGLALWTGAQLVPLPEEVVSVIAPKRAEWHRTFLPAAAEALPGEAAVPRPSWVPVSVNPGGTRDFLSRVLALFLVYAAVRNWLASRDSFRRFAWAATLNGSALALFAIAQSYLSPRNVVFGVAVDGTAYGPFVCRNHYPDYLHLCIGLALGLLLPPRGEQPETSAGETFPERLLEAVLAPVRLVTSARSLGLALAVGLMVVSVPFSLSRGGAMAGLAAGVGAALLARSGGRGAGGRLAVAGVLGVAVLLGGWFGAGAVEARLATVASGEAFESRIPMWTDALRAVPGTWLTGSGAGSFQWVEATVRTAATSTVVYDSAHNEYLEALVDGGVIGLGLTLLLAAGALVVIGRGYRRRRERSAGPMLLGAWFGLAALAFHSAGDFGIRIPAVALLATAVAGFAVAAAEDPEFGRAKVRTRVRTRTRSRAGAVPEVNPSSEPSDPPAPAGPQETDPARWAASGPAAVLAGVMMVAASLAVALDFRGRTLAERQTRYADIVLRSRADRPLARRAEYLAAAARARPRDTAALTDAADAHFDAAREETILLTGAIAGPALAALDDPSLIPADAEAHVEAGLRLARAARAACPLNPRPHHLLGKYAGRFDAAEPAGTHFGRAKKLISVDPYIWYRVGLEAFEQDDFPAAWENWHGSLARSPRYLVPIVTAAGSRLTSPELVSRVIPANPEVLAAAADVLYPDRLRSAADRKPFLVAAGKAAEVKTATPPQLAAAAAAAEELGDAPAAAGFWQRAVTAAPNSETVREGIARFLEREERYADAIPHLNWLVGKRYRDAALKDRLEAAKHGAKLAAELAK